MARKRESQMLTVRLPRDRTAFPETFTEAQCLDLLAFHEAGHALAMYRHGVAIARVWIDIDKGGGCDPVKPFKIPLEVKSWVASRGEYMLRISHQTRVACSLLAQILLAGSAAERERARAKYGLDIREPVYFTPAGHGDESTLSEVIEGVFTAASSRTRFLNVNKRRAWELVGALEPFAAVAKLSAALKRNHVLSGKAATAILASVRF